MLRADRVTVRYGAVVAVRGVSLSVEAGAVVAVLGPNGAGKTSLLRAISGVAAHDGTVTAGDSAISSPETAVSAGVVHVPQGRGLFRTLTVGQNISLAADRDGAVHARTRIPELDGWWQRRVGSLSGGEQVLVALGRLLAARPRYALIDELALGLAPNALRRVETELRRLRDDGAGLVVVEQHAPRALDLADRVIVLERGEALIDGEASSVDAGRLAELALGLRR